MIMQPGLESLPEHKERSGAYTILYLSTWTGRRAMKDRGKVINMTGVSGIWISHPLVNDTLQSVSSLFQPPCTNILDHLVNIKTIG